MRRIDPREQLFESIVRLRRAEREMPANRDIVVVRSRLEEELGYTVSRSLAARWLGVSHTALARWVRAGDIPVVYGPAGRQGIPLATLLGLREAMERERESGTRRRHVLEPTMLRGRARARAIRIQALLPDEDLSAGGHRKADLRSLAYHRVLAPRLRRPMVDDALHLLWQWDDQEKIDPRYAERWEQILRKPVTEIRRTISDAGPSARDLRQNSPFAGMLSEAERRKILDEIG